MLIETHIDANRLLTRCTDRAIGALAKLRSAEAQSDLAGAYYHRAQRNDDAIDLLRAMRAANEAVAIGPKHAPAHFNRALVQQTIGLHADAIVSLDRFLALESDAEWKGEGLRRRNHLARVVSNDAATRWPRIREKYLRPLNDVSSEEVMRDVRVAVAAARELVMNDLLFAHKHNAWAQKNALLIAQAIGSVTGDRYLVDRMRSSQAANQSIEILAKRYPSILARQQFVEGYALFSADRHVDSLNAYRLALDHYGQLKYRDAEAATWARIAGQLRVLGDISESWRAALRAQRAFHGVAGNQWRSTIIAEAATTATVLGYPEIALQYRHAFIESLRAAMVHAPGSVDMNVVSAAYRSRAETYVALGKYAEAESDLAEAARLNAQPVDQRMREILQAQLFHAQAKIAMRSAPARAVEKFTQSLQVGGPHFYGTYRAMLYVERSEANRLAGRETAANADLEQALEELHNEEKTILTQRKPGEMEKLWSSYFGRFRETYELVVRQYVRRKDIVRAFRYAERVRGYEPLMLVLQSTTVPEEFRAALGKFVPMELDAIQAKLPADTFLVQYLVLEQETLVWVVSADGVAQLQLNVSRTEVDDWAAQLQKAVVQQDPPAFEDGLIGPSDALLRDPLASIAKMRAGRAGLPRIVFIADRSMHGLPFNALRDRQARRYLVETAIVETAPSATLYVHSLLRNQAIPHEPRPSALLVLNPAFDNTLPYTQKLQPLPYAQRERETIGKYYPEKSILLGDGATVAAFLAEAHKHTVIHISAHGRPNPQEPHRSELLLAKTATDDGMLTAEELLTSLELDRTRLMIIAACSSAGGAPVGPEGVAPLVRPVLAAGVPAVIGSLWDVGDKAASELLTRFHMHYQLGMDAASALRAAQLDLLNGGDHQVLAWAPFQVIGHASSPFGGPTTQPNTQRSQ